MLPQFLKNHKFTHTLTLNFIVGLHPTDTTAQGLRGCVPVVVWGSPCPALHGALSLQDWKGNRRAGVCCPQDALVGQRPPTPFAPKLPFMLAPGAGSPCLALLCAPCPPQSPLRYTFRTHLPVLLGPVALNKSARNQRHPKTQHIQCVGFNT